MLLVEAVSLGIKEKQCDSCKQIKPLSSFEITYSHQLRGKLHGHCYTCRILTLVNNVDAIVKQKRS